MSFRAAPSPATHVYCLVWNAADLEAARLLANAVPRVVLCETTEDVRLAQRGPLAGALALPGEVWLAPPAVLVGRLRDGPDSLTKSLEREGLSKKTPRTG